MTTEIDLDKLTLQEQVQLLELLKAKDIAKRRNWLQRYTPYPKQKLFHAQGKNFRERMFMASNQSGKTLGASAELAMHVTGVYPDWWEGLRFSRGVSCLAGSESFELNKKGMQRLLIGPAENEDEWGTGAIPHDRIKRITRQQGVQDAIAAVVVKHVSGEDSIIKFSSYEQGRTKWQADTVDLIWFDEEPPLDVYMEGITRTNVTGGPIMTTFTPLLGMSAVVRLFMPLAGERSAQRTLISMTIEDALHYTPEQRESILESYPEHEREARAYGRPVLGEGMVFPVAESAIRVTPFPIPNHWPRLCGLDIGWDHPTAAAWIAYDRDTDTIYVYKTYRAAKTTVALHATQLLAQGQWIPVAWPHDALIHDKATGKQVKEQYKEYGVNMVAKHATFDDKDNSNFSFEAGVSEMVDRMQTGRWKVFSVCEEWWQEFRGYHRKDGKVVKQDDDTLSASRIAMMMRRFAVTPRDSVGSGTVKQNATPRIPGFGVLDSTTGY